VSSLRKVSRKISMILRHRYLSHCKIEIIDIKLNSQVSQQMKSNYVMNWLRSRCEGKTQDFYLKSNRELWQELQLENLFKSFDEDGSNSLDVRELHDMF